MEDTTDIERSRAINGRRSNQVAPLILQNNLMLAQAEEPDRSLLLQSRNSPNEMEKIETASFCEAEIPQPQSPQKVLNFYDNFQNEDSK